MITETQRSHILLIKEIISNFAGEDIAHKTRKREIVQARISFYTILKNKYRPLITLAEIGKFVNQDHATVLHGLGKFESQFKDVDFKTFHLMCEEEVKKIPSGVDGFNNLFLDNTIAQMKSVTSVMVLELVRDKIDCRINEIVKK